MSGNVKLALSHVVPDLVLKVLKGQDPLHILGEGNQVRHYTYGGDLAHGIRLAMESPAAVNDDFNLSTAASHDRPRAGRGHLAQGPHGRPPIPLRQRRAVRARRPAPDPGRPQGDGGPRVRGVDDARHDARRGHPVDPGRSGGRPAVTGPTHGSTHGSLRRPLRRPRGQRARTPSGARSSGSCSGTSIADAPLLDIACDRGHFIRFVDGAGAMGDRHPGRRRRRCRPRSGSSSRPGSIWRTSCRTGTSGRSS